MNNRNLARLHNAAPILPIDSPLRSDRNEGFTTRQKIAASALAAAALFGFFKLTAEKSVYSKHQIENMPTQPVTVNYGDGPQAVIQRVDPIGAKNAEVLDELAQDIQPQGIGKDHMFIIGQNVNAPIDPADLHK